MTLTTLRRIRKPTHQAHNASWIPSGRVEYAYYFVLAYSLLSAYLGIELPLIAAGMTIALAGFCFKQMGPRIKEVYAPISLLLACQISYILVQIAMHGASVMDDTIRNFILWVSGMILVQSLRLRQGFLQRCAIVLFV